ncbi:nuclear transport factor 2 family protein [Pseudarthrobacter sp. NPDC080039]|uniref:nuclear transport factor 2 family protein n=1 Tax=unclassified Pseudarthrobacter TaxID=2647000 RepID=UPI00344E9CDF
MDDLTRLVIENECKKLMTLYCWHIDHLDPAAFAELFAEDAEYKPSVEPKPIVGQGSIRRWAEAYPKRFLSRHVSTNQFVEVVDENHARGVSYAIVWRDSEPADDAVSANVTPRSLVEYVDTFRRTPGGWRFATRYYRMLFLQEDAAQRPERWTGFPATSGSLRVI